MLNLVLALAMVLGMWWCLKRDDPSLRIRDYVGAWAYIFAMSGIIVALAYAARAYLRFMVVLISSPWTLIAVVVLLVTMGIANNRKR